MDGIGDRGAVLVRAAPINRDTNGGIGRGTPPTGDRERAGARALRRDPGTTDRPRRLSAFARWRSLRIPSPTSRTACSAGSGLGRPTCCSLGPRQPSSTGRRSTVHGTALVVRSGWTISTSTTCATLGTLAAGTGGQHEGTDGPHGPRQRPCRPHLPARIGGERRAHRRAAVGDDARRLGRSESNTDGGPRPRSAESERNG